MSGGVDWDLAERVAIKIATRNEVLDQYALDRMDAHFREFTPQAEELVGLETGLWSANGKARAKLVDRPDWIRANIASFQRLLSPIVGKLEEMEDGFSANVTKRVTGVEVGTMLGWMSRRVLGQYDLLLTEDETADDQDWVYYVGPNVLGLERRHGFAPEQFRLWLALHEVTHRAQFTGVPWLRDHFVSLVNQTLENVDPDSSRMMEIVQEVIKARRDGADPLADGGIPALIAGPEQKIVLEQIGGMMSLLEGHGDITMDRAGVGIVTDSDFFAETLRTRRNSAKGLTRIVLKLVGLEAKMNQYAAGENFIHQIERHPLGKQIIDYAWQDAESLPSLEEIKNPQQWVERVVPVNALPLAS